MPLKCDPARKIVDDSGFLRTPDRLLKFHGTHVWWLEVLKMITSTCGPYYLGGSTTLNPSTPSSAPRHKSSKGGVALLVSATTVPHRSSSARLFTVARVL
jgi:hypothetical protein